MRRQVERWHAAHVDHMDQMGISISVEAIIKACVTYPKDGFTTRG
ncbi:hypothetical protein [Cryobacterium sp. Hh7]|nr:hypothetical protein [Cryobacterium sp. Hh7]